MVSVLLLHHRHIREVRQIKWLRLQQQQQQQQHEQSQPAGSTRAQNEEKAKRLFQMVYAQMVGGGREGGWIKWIVVMRVPVDIKLSLCINTAERK